MNSEHANCPSLPLSASDIGHITFCPNCGVVSVTIQSITVRFESPAFDDLSRMIGRARAALIRSAGAAPARAVEPELCH